MVKYTKISASPLVFLGSEEIEKAADEKAAYLAARRLADARAAASAAARRATLAADRGPAPIVVKKLRLAAPGVLPLPGKGACLAPLDGSSKRVKKAPKTPENSPELQVHTIDLKPGLSKHSEKAVKLRSRCLQVGKSLENRGANRMALLKAGKKIQNCRVVGLFQEVSPTVHYKVGAALCKQRLCPNCQRVLSAKRKENTLNWFNLNRDALRKYFFYHMVLTVPHSEAEGVRTGLYVGEILENFAALRGTAKGLGVKTRKRVSGWWSSWIAGGFYHVETKPALGDSTAHTHLHIIVLAKKQLWNAATKSAFLQEIEPRWAAITHNDKLFKGVFVDPVYYIDEETSKRVNCHFGSSLNLEAAVSEAAKYTMKADTATLDAFSDDFLTDMLTTKNRYYGRFGCLNAKDPSSAQFQKLDMLCTDFKDLEQVSAIEAARLFNPETGELVKKEDTRLLVTPFRNMRATETPGWVEGTTKPAKHRLAGERVVVGETVYILEKEVSYLAYYGPDDKQLAIGRMGKSLTNDYNPNFDIL